MCPGDQLTVNGCPSIPPVGGGPAAVCQGDPWFSLTTASGTVLASPAQYVNGALATSADDYTQCAAWVGMPSGQTPSMCPYYSYRYPTSLACGTVVIWPGFYGNFGGIAASTLTVTLVRASK